MHPLIFVDGKQRSIGKVLDEMNLFHKIQLQHQENKKDMNLVLDRLNIASIINKIQFINIMRDAPINKKPPRFHARAFYTDYYQR